MMRSEDLAPLLAGPGADPAAVRWGQGVVVAWDADTGANTIRYQGVDLANLPIVASSAEILQITEGDVVGLNIIGGGGSATIYIVGRITLPGQQAKQAVINTLSDNVFSASVPTAETLGIGGAWSNLATFGPSLPNIEITNGRCLVFVGCYFSHGGALITFGAMSFEVSGASSVAAFAPRGVAKSTSNESWIVSGSKAVLLEGLNNGLHTFTAKYQNNSTAGNVSFQDRNLTVVAF